jgi:hypothetical protein
MGGGEGREEGREKIEKGELKREENEGISINRAGAVGLTWSERPGP